jgi:hypothetical protein
MTLLNKQSQTGNKGRSSSLRNKGDNIKENEKDSSCSIHGGEERNSYSSLS